MANDPARPLPPDDEGKLSPAPLSGTRAQSVQRLQIGLFGLATMVLLVGLANIIIDNARETEAGVVPEAAPTVAVPDIAEPAADPLADAGVVPEAPAPEETGASVQAPAQTINVPEIEAP